MVKRVPVAGSSSRSANSAPRNAIGASPSHVHSTTAGPTRGRLSLAWASPARWRECRRPLVAGLITLMASLVAVAGLAWWRAQIPPAWWMPVSSQSELADQFEAALINEGTRVRPSNAPWTVDVREEAINAWLAGKLDAWMSSRGTPTGELGGACVRIVEGELFAGARVQDGRAVWSASVKPEVSKGALRLGVTSAAVGRLSIPPSWIAQGLAKITGGRAMGPTVLMSPWIRLADRRLVEVLGADCRDGVVTLTCRTVPRGG